MGGGAAGKVFPRQIPPVGGALILPASFFFTLSPTLPVTSIPAFPAELTLEEYTFYSPLPLAPLHPHHAPLEGRDLSFISRTLEYPA